MVAALLVVLDVEVDHGDDGHDLQDGEGREAQEGNDEVGPWPVAVRQARRL